MKYGFIFLITISMMFGGVCIGAIKMGQGYMDSLYKSSSHASIDEISYSMRNNYLACSDSTKSPNYRCR